MTKSKFLLERDRSTGTLTSKKVSATRGTFSTSVAIVVRGATKNSERSIRKNADVYSEALKRLADR